MVQRFAAEGAIVQASDVNGQELERLRRQFGDDAVSEVDVSSTDAVNGWVADVLDRHGQVDVMVCNAGIFDDSRVESMSDGSWARVVDVNLSGVFRCIRAAYSTMRQRGYGRILTMSSMSWRGNFGQANYAAAKAGVVGMTRTVALEGAAHGVTVNAIAPGLIDTPMLASMDSGGREKLKSRIPMKRIGLPSDIAESAAFLCSEGAGYITGVVLDVDGGISIGSALR